MYTICVISPGYPTKTHPFFPFVKMIVDEFCKQGNNIYVIAPQSLLKCLFRGVERHPFLSSYFYGDTGVTVYQPFYISLGNRLDVINQFFLKKVVKKVLKKLPVKPDVIYSHFWQSGFTGYEYALSHKVPIFVASGESSISFRADSLTKTNYCQYISGLICVSTKNKDESIQLGLTDGRNSIVIPNAIDSTIFYKKDKNELRSRYGIDKDAFIVCFVGWFNERKGAYRVSKAIDRLNNKNINSFFIGAGLDNELIEPECKGILFKGYLPHDIVPDYLNMSDVFVLPTLREGCCNAVVEAMACGLPIISSDLPFNWDVLNQTNSVLIDPYNIDEIADAINSFYEDSSKRALLSKGALSTAKDLTIEERSRKILKFIINTKH